MNKSDLKSNIKLCKTKNADFMVLWVNICKEQYRKENDWIGKLRSLGIKASHPDDGWVSRNRNEVYLCYPHFNDGLQIGDKLALGTPDQYRIVKIIGHRSTNFILKMDYWKFEEQNKK